jgi:hypothetical protein
MKKELYLQELESLIRTLDFIQEEQAFIKKKLTNYIDAIDQASLIVWAEDMQQQILNRELALQLIKKDILSIKSSKIIDTELLKRDKQQVGYLEQEFLLWKHAFDKQIETVGTV